MGRGRGSKPDWGKKEKEVGKDWGGKEARKKNNDVH